MSLQRSFMTDIPIIHTNLLSRGRKQLASQLSILKLSRPDVSYWTWDQGHHRQPYFCFFPGLTSVDWEGWSTSNFHLRQMISHHKLPFLICNISWPSSPAYGVSISQLGMPTEDAYSSGHLVLSHFGTCTCSNVETNLSWTCLVSGLRTSLGTSLLRLYDTSGPAPHMNVLFWVQGDFPVSN